MNQWYEHFWNTGYSTVLNNTGELEEVQKRIKRMIKNLEKCFPRKTLKRWGLFTSDRRQITGDVTKVYKITNGPGKVDLKLLFSLILQSRTRGR